MQIRGTGVSFERVSELVSKVSAEYGGNVIMHPDARAIGGADPDYGFTGRLRTVTSTGPGARRSASWHKPRRTVAACWHAYRDVLRAILTEYPHARVRTMLATYNGLDGFETTYPGTGDLNIGAIAFPKYMPDLCDCQGWE
jgi:hypothetical protein